jgi:hypothetical protein
VSAALGHAITAYSLCLAFVVAGILILRFRNDLAQSISRRFPRNRTFVTSNFEADPADVAYWRLRLVTVGIFAVCLCGFIVIITLIYPQGFNT